ncbi:MAG TPA: amino acid adenylation domain-containing protein, partial [Pyrinomonadaceae bacterium]
MQNTPVQQLTLSDVTIRQLKAGNRTARFDLSVDIWEVADGLVGACEYNTDLFEEATVKRLLGHFQTFLENAVARPDEPLHALPFLAAEERERLLGEWNHAPLPRPRAHCLHELFEAQAARHADDIALVCGAERLTFAELNRRANRLAHYLRRQGVGPDTRVGICVERGVRMVVGLLGILKAGGAYVPLDIAYPEERLAFMLEDAGVALLLTSERVAAQVPGRRGERVLRLDADWELVEREGGENPARLTTPDNLAYVIYTSGSTGRPKGVQVEHASVISLLEATRTLCDSRGDVWTVFHSYAFDFSVWEIWACLLNGGCLVVVPTDVAQTPAAFLELLRAERVTVLNQTPSGLRQLTSARGELAGGGAGLSLRLIVCGGEALPTELVPQLSEWGVPLWNFYGPTEATVWATARPIEADGSGRASYPVGRALANTEAYVLDENLQLVPAGVAGELHVGGAGLARGYLNRPALTAERFVPHPFSTRPGERLYRTGDLARHLPDGELEFLGRMDHQVKVRGFRIELGEIEAVLAEHEGIREAAVVAREEGGDRRLVAYVVAAPGDEADAAGLRAHLRGRLPEYMVPSAFVRLEELPLTPNGKLDRRALPPPGEALLLPSAAPDFVAARTATEEIISGIFAHLLRLPSVSVADNFFELGGHSLLATQVVSWIRDSLGVEIALRRLFESPTVAGLAEAVEGERRERRGVKGVALRRVGRGADGMMPLSYAQQRLWFLDQLEPGNTTFNIPVALRLEGALDLAALERTFSEVVRRHEVLRTRFAVVEGRPVQVVEEAAPVSLGLTDLSRLGREEGEREVERLAKEEAARPFDLSGGALWRASLVRVGSEEHVLLVTMHHIISDGWSLGVLVGEVSRLYGAFCRGEESPLEELPVQYADYAAWQREYLSGETLEEELGYWRERLRGAPTLVTIPPSGRLRPAVLSGRGARHPLALGEELSEGVRELSRASGATPFMVLMSAFQWLVAHHAGASDLVVGTDVANRTRRETEPLIGFFVNQAALRCRADEGESFRRMVRGVREAALGAYEHQEAPFEKVVEAAGPERRANLSPLFQLKL